MKQLSPIVHKDLKNFKPVKQELLAQRPPLDLRKPEYADPKDPKTWKVL